ncbi:MAG: hypothetical protein OEX08_03410 [Candidatus Nomurabacteria bacterium]|nr:hypothetical protein [Candidatus Nomurabacteria bacterium]
MKGLIIIFIILLVDSIGANLTSWLGAKWYTKHFRIMSRYFPASKGWSAWYLFLVLLIGWILMQVGAF